MNLFDKVDSRWFILRTDDDDEEPIAVVELPDVASIPNSPIAFCDIERQSIESDRVEITWTGTMGSVIATLSFHWSGKSRTDGIDLDEVKPTDSLKHIAKKRTKKSLYFHEVDAAEAQTLLVISQLDWFRCSKVFRYSKDRNVEIDVNYVGTMEEG